MSYGSMKHRLLTFVAIILSFLVSYSWESKQILTEILKRNNRIMDDFLQNLTPIERNAYHLLSRHYRLHRSWDYHRKRIQKFKKLVLKDKKATDTIGTDTVGSDRMKLLYCSPPNPCPSPKILPGAKHCLKKYPINDMMEFNRHWEQSQSFIKCSCDIKHNKFCPKPISDV